MTLVRLVAGRSSSYRHYSILYSLRQTRFPHTLQRSFSAAPSLYKPQNQVRDGRREEDGKKPGYTIRYLEEVESGKLQDQSHTEEDVAELKAKLAEVEKELKQFEEKEEFKDGSGSQDAFKEIFEDLFEESKLDFSSDQKRNDMMTGDLSTSDAGGADKLASLKAGELKDTDMDKIWAQLPNHMKSGMTKEQLKHLLNDEDSPLPQFPKPNSQYEDQDDGLDIEERIKREIFGHTEDKDPLHVGIPEHVTVHMNGFNKAMRDVASQSKDPKSIGLLWTKYEQCKKSVPGFLQEIPPQVWSILWLSQWGGNLVPESRQSHLWVLVNDMLEVGHPLNHDQKLVHIEYEFSEGDKRLAMKTWRHEYSALKSGDPKRDDYRDLGVRLHVEAGLLAEAQDLIFGKERQGNVRASDVAILVAAKASKNDETNLKMAWSLYLDMRERLDNTITLEDYDQIAMTFLGVNRPNLAVAVFKDMVLSVGSRSRNSDTQSRSFELIQKLQATASNKDELESISLQTLSSLPKQLENKYFYASWIKRLIGLNEVDATIQVLELMFQRGVRPDARHLNGIIGAWLRGPDKAKHELGLQIAWTMVNERLKFVARRNNIAAGNTTTVGEMDKGKVVPPYISQNLPSANIETFCLLLLYYQRRSMTQSIEHVTNYLKEAEIAPNSFFMNHLIYAALRRQDIGKAWKIYDSGTKSIAPDLETFSALWNCEKVFTGGRSTNAPEFPRSRRLFLHMSRWFYNLQGRSLNDTLQAFSAEMYNEIIRCFSFQKDVEGTLVALYALRDMFNAYPNPETERILLIQLARLGEGPVKRRKRNRSDTRFTVNANSKQDFARITKLVTLFNEQRIQELKEKGIEDSSLTGKERREEDLYRIVEILRICLRHQAGMETHQMCPQEEHIGDVAEEMGMSSIDMSPPQI